jgi:hypothetical protein
MKNVIVSMVAVAGIAAVASANSTLRYEVRPVGGEWASSITVAPGTQVEFRALVTYTGTATPIGLANATFQPTVSNWNAGTDTLAAFRNVGTSPATGGVLANSGQYGRILPYAAAGISTTNALRGHLNTVAGVNFLRVAQNNTTNWAGVSSATTGTGAANNFNGAGGIATGQKPFSQVVAGVDPAYDLDTTDVEVLRLAITVGGNVERTLQISTPAEGIFRNATSGLRIFSWHATQNDNTGSVSGPVTIVPASITVPTPGALALLGLGGLAAARRRR